MSIQHTPTSAFGTVETLHQGYRLHFDRQYPLPAADLAGWLTDPDRTRLWWAESRAELTVGGRFDLRWLNGDNGEPMEWWNGRVSALGLPWLLEHTNETHGLLRWELEEAGDGTRLRFSNTITPQQERFVTLSLAGWHLHLDHLADVLAGGAIDWGNWYPLYEQRWEEIHQRYQQRTNLP